MVREHWWRNQGPVDETVLRQWITANKVAPDTLVWRTGMQDWIAAETIRPDWFSRTSNRTNATVRAASNGQSEFHLNRFWKFTVIVVLIWLIVTSLLFSMIYLLGLSVPMPS